MVKVRTLEDIALGQATAPEARTILSAELKMHGRDAGRRVYTALRAWVWKALNERRRDSELRDWFDILKRTGAYFLDHDKACAERISVLHELIYESISVSELLPARELLKRQHVKEAIVALRDAPGQKLERTRIGALLKLRQANLTRVLNLMSACGLIERTAFGKHAIFQLTPMGRGVALQSPSSQQFKVTDIVVSDPRHDHLPLTCPDSSDHG